LEREVLPPDRRIVRIVGELDDTEERVPPFLLPLEDVDEECDDPQRHKGGGNGGEHQPRVPRPWAFPGLDGISHARVGLSLQVSNG
jgi:hypothetical protein